MKLLLKSSNPMRSSNGGEYAKGYRVFMREGIAIAEIDRCYGSDFAGEYTHEYRLPGLSLAQAERLVEENPEVFASMCAWGRVEKLCTEFCAAGR